MEMLSVADHFASPVAVLLTGIFMVIESLSIAMCIIVVLQYKRVVSKHKLLPHAIQHTLEEEPEKGTNFLLNIYIILTIVVVIGTVVLFLFQPHLF